MAVRCRRGRRGAGPFTPRSLGLSVQPSLQQRGYVARGRGLASTRFAETLTAHSTVTARDCKRREAVTPRGVRSAFQSRATPRQAPRGSAYSLRAAHSQSPRQRPDTCATRAKAGRGGAFGPWIPPGSRLRASGLQPGPRTGVQRADVGSLSQPAQQAGPDRCAPCTPAQPRLRRAVPGEPGVWDGWGHIISKGRDGVGRVGTGGGSAV